MLESGDILHLNVVLLGENGNIVRFAYIPIDNIIYDTFSDEEIENIFDEVTDNYAIECEHIVMALWREVDLEEGWE